MTKIQTRSMREEKIAKLVTDIAVSNHQIAMSEEVKTAAIEIFTRQTTRRHDLQIYDILIIDKNYSVICLVKRNKLDEDFYFKEAPIKVSLRDDVEIQEVLNDDDTINWAIVSEPHMYGSLVAILERSIEYCLHPSRTDVVEVTNYEKPLLLLMQDINWGFFKESMTEEEVEQ